MENLTLQEYWDLVDRIKREEAAEPQYTLEDLLAILDLGGKF